MNTFKSDKIIYAVRHCSATGQEFDACLTEQGKYQSQLLASFFDAYNIDRILSSSFQRALDSVTPLSQKKGIAIEVDDRLVERNLGILPGSDWKYYLRQTFDDHQLTFENGESTAVALARANTVADEILNHKARHTLIVSHGNLMTLFLRCFDASMGFDAWQNLSNPDVFQISKADGSWTVARIWTNH